MAGKKQASLCCQLSLFAEWQIIRVENEANSINQEATKTQAGMQYAQKLIHAMICGQVRTVLRRKLRLPYWAHWLHQCIHINIQYVQTVVQQCLCYHGSFVFFQLRRSHQILIPHKGSCLTNRFEVNYNFLQMSFLSPLAFINLLWLQVSPETLLCRTRTGFVLDLAYWLQTTYVFSRSTYMQCCQLCNFWPIKGDWWFIRPASNVGRGGN